MMWQGRRDDGCIRGCHRSGATPHITGSSIVDVLLSVLFLQLSHILAERLTRGFRRLTPQTCSTYDHYFWTHERAWKLLTPADPTPMV
jgi:hypothetical protein